MGADRSLHQKASQERAHPHTQIPAHDRTNTDGSSYQVLWGYHRGVSNDSNKVELHAELDGTICKEGVGGRGVSEAVCTNPAAPEEHTQAECVHDAKMVHDILGKWQN